MIATLIGSAITGALAAVGTYFLMRWIGLPVSAWWMFTCAAVMFLWELWNA
jgi:hypothetical protein